MYTNVLFFRQDRYDSLRICTGEELLNKLSNLRLFMVRNDNVTRPRLPYFVFLCNLFSFSQVGCGAIGCELLKNFALLGIGGSRSGLVCFFFSFCDLSHS